MTETTARIRWERNDDGSTVTAAHEGYVGTIGEPLFFIFEPDDRDPWWILTSSLPGLPGAGRAERRAHGDDTDQLKAEAERWLEEFVVSLGAVFPAPGETLIAIEQEGRPAAFFDEHDLDVIAREDVNPAPAAGTE